MDLLKKDFTRRAQIYMYVKRGDISRDTIQRNGNLVQPFTFLKFNQGELAILPQSHMQVLWEAKQRRWRLMCTFLTVHQGELTVLPQSHMESKIEMVEIDEHCRRLDKVKPVDIHSNISSCTSEIMRVECPHPYEFPKRECTQRSRSSSRPSKRISKATSILPECMMDVTFDHCFRNMWSESPEGRRKMCTYLTCYYFNKYALEEHSRDKVLGWINAQNIFSKKYVFVPILLWSHWSLLVFCNLSEGLMSETRTPCILLLDSLHEYGSPQKLEPLIRSFVLEIFDTGGGPEPRDMVENIPLLVPKVPQQRNDMDCGIFVLYYINMFLKSAPESFIVSDGYPYFMMEDWFTERQVKVFYDKLEALGLQSDEDVVCLNSDSDDGIDEL